MRNIFKSEGFWITLCMVFWLAAQVTGGLFVKHVIYGSDIQVLGGVFWGFFVGLTPLIILGTILNTRSRKKYPNLYGMNSNAKEE